MQCIKVYKSINYEFSEQVKKDNIENVTIDDLVAKVTPIGRQKVPVTVKEEILQRLRNFLEED